MGSGKEEQWWGNGNLYWGWRKDDLFELGLSLTLST